MTDPWRQQNEGNGPRGIPEGNTFRDLIPSFVIVAAVIGALALAGWLIGDALGVFPSAEDGLHVGFLIAILVFLCSGLITGLRANIAGAIKSILAWMAIGLIAITGYAYRDELTVIWDRIAGELLPGSAVRADRSLMMRAAVNGSFFMEVFLNGQRTRMLVDTGASALALSPGDARTAGLDPARLRYDVPIRTADGATRAARVVLGTVQVGGLTLRNYPGLVLRQGTMSLLGVDILRRFRSFEIRGDRLILRW
ncbi:MAG: TIGR02281 family clan AA aspartic protease [Rhodospirillaceae bacterium]|nr:TIGR02281 family clan AA aspartic protease [Rhodospirillaceae bacterium]MCY4238357.1 TIGR02281 family clan AA aspartic protease [Rhodospirillaceae bacterium]MCY4310392.1 TIGR02281 family clan AA aspartic protease [Rhodospirillaceae bacterium]